MFDRAVILAGRLGTRLRPYTTVFPKPLMPIGDLPILEVIVRQLALAGTRRITLAVNHQADLFRAFFADGKRWNLCIDYSLEEKPLGTMAPLKLIPDLPEHFLLMNGDVLTDLDYRAFCQAHHAGGGVFTICATKRTQRIDYGVLGADENSRLVSFREKPSYDFLVSMGIYAMNRQVLKVIPEEAKFGFDDLMGELLARREKIQILPFEGRWLDIGRPDDYELAIDEFESMRSQYLRDE
jgi:NDP-sugar pyrophosphorylase family protein